jgi:DNA-binding MarR family transcriptional regulator
MSSGNHSAAPTPDTAVGRVRPVPGPHYYRFLRTSHILSSALRELLEEHFLHDATHHRISRLQFCLLKLIALNADLQVGELAHCLGVSPAVASKNIDKLERLELVSRSSCSEDRRAILLTATADGHELVQAYERLKAERLGPVIAALDADELDQLCTSLERVCRALLRREDIIQSACLRCAGYYHADCSVGQDHGGCTLLDRRAVRAGLDEEGSRA